jgi:T5SS/PEP-CTERM-associated repeat protein
MSGFTWIGSDGTYTTAADWSPSQGAPPGPDSFATIAQSGVLVTDGVSPFILGDAADGSLLVEDTATMQLLTGSHLVVGSLANSDGTLAIVAGGTFIDSSGTFGDMIGESIGSVGTLFVDGSDSQFQTTGRLFVGDSGTGTLLVEDGGLVTSTGTGSSSNASIVIGNKTGASGEVGVVGTTSLLEAFGRIQVGQSGSGILGVLDGGTVEAASIPSANYDQIVAGGNPGSSGTIYVSDAGSVLDADGGAIGIGVPGTTTGAMTTGVLVVTNGATVEGGTANAANQAGFLVGYEGAVSSIPSIVAEGFVTLTGSGTSLSVQGGAQFGRSGSAVLVMANSANATLGSDPGTVDGGVHFANAAGSTAQATISSFATLASSGNIIVGQGGDAMVVVNTGAQMSSFLDAADLSAAQAGILIAEDGGSSTLTVSDLGTGISSNGNIVVGRGGQGLLTIENGATAITSALVRLGASAVGSGEIHVTGTDSVLSGQMLLDGLDAAGTLEAGSGDLVVDGGGDAVFTASASLGGGAMLSVANGSGIEIGGTGDPLAGHVTVDAGGTLSGDGTVVGGVIDNGLVDATGGLLQFLSPVGGSGTYAIAQSGVLELSLGGSLGTDVMFTGAGILKLDTPGSFAGTIAVTAAGGTIDVVGVTNATPTIVGNMLEVGTYDFALLGNDTVVGVSADGGVGTLAGTDVVVACFAAGTRIRTPDGDIPVEALRIGQLVETVGSAPRPIRWIGRRSYHNRFVRNDPAVMPIRIAGGALGDGVPRRDLLVSPEHAMFLDGALVAAKLLVNGTTITQVRHLDRIDYFHVELDSHDILFAEGAPSESFVDCDSRFMFQNAAEFAQLYPDDAGASWSFCAPRLEEGAKLAALQRRLAPRPPQPEAMRRATGHLDTVTHEGCTGWAWIPSDPAASVEVEILVDGGVIGRVTANHLRADVRDAGFGTGRYGFAFTFTRPLSRFAWHDVSARVAGGLDLKGAVDLPAEAEAGPPSLSTVAEFLRGRAATQGGALEVAAFLQEQWQILHRTPARRIGTAPLALVLDERMPTPQRDGGSRAIVSHMRALVRLGYEVVFAPVEPALVPGGVLPDHPEIACGAQAVEQILRRHSDAALVYVHRVGTMTLYGELIRRICPAARLLYSVADLHFLRLQRQAMVLGQPALLAESHRVQDQEFHAVRMADVTVTHSDHEAALLRRAIPGARVRVVPFDMPCRQIPTPPAERQGVVFVGGTSHAPNADAAGWLQREIMPRVASADRSIRCVLVGDGFAPVSENALAEIYATSRLSVAPLRFGAGVKGKVVESLAAGVPCVMSPIAAEGLQLPDTLAGLIGHNADELARLIIRLHANQDEYSALAAAGLAFVAKSWSETAVDEGLAAAAACSRTPMVGRRVQQPTGL